MKQFWQITLSYIVLFLFNHILIAQENGRTDSLRVVYSDSALTDTLDRIEKIPPAKPIELQPVWYDLDGITRTISDSLDNEVFRFDQILYLNYNGASDVFRMRPEIQIIDFLEMGLPRYIAPVNMLPHQSAVLMDGEVLNNPVSGMYNMRMLPLDAFRSVEHSPNTIVGRSGMYGLTQSAQYTSRYLDPEEPYTRLMFRQGDFGYTDLDITFSSRINRQMAFQLGGINKYYDPNGYRGVNYRGSFSFQITPRIFWRTRFHINDEGADVYSRSRFSSYSYKDRRADIYTDLTMLDDDSLGGDWHVRFWYTNSQRRANSRVDSFYVENKFKRFAAQAERLWNFSRVLIMVGLSGSQNLVWGSAYQREYFDWDLAGWVNAKFTLTNSFRIDGRLRTDYVWGQRFWISPQLALLWQRDRKTAVRLNISQTQRFPNRSERSFAYYGLSGNKDLQEETLQNAVIKLKHAFSPYLQIEGTWGYSHLQNEIRFEGSTFRQTGNERSFNYFTAAFHSGVYKFKLAAGGLYSLSDVDLAPAASFWAEARYHDVWFKGALIFDAVVSYYWYDQRNTLYYHPVIERFYWGKALNPAYNIYTFKLMATVRDLQLYMAMDNPQAFSYQIIDGYYEYYRRIRFGLNWVLWD